MSKKKVSLDVLMHDIDKQFVTIKEDKAFAVFRGVFDQVHEAIKKVDNYYDKYSSKIAHAGSFYDGVKVGQLDEFDMDIIIRLPISYEDGPNGIIIENDIPGFVKLKIGNAFDYLDKREEWESHHKVTRDWRDDEKYLLQNQFRSWMESAVSKAINLLDRKVEVNGIQYNLTYKKSGPAFTLNVTNVEVPFELDVDLVPVIRFIPPRWPEEYRKIDVDGGADKNSWYVVPKPNKSIQDQKEQNRCWRLAFHDQEKDFMKGYKNLKPTLRMMKKLRDTMKMKAIASYYIKTLFLWELEAKDDKKYWESKPSILFKDMVQKLHDALDEKKIPYFWNPGYNLIGGLNEGGLRKLDSDKAKLKKLITKIEENACEDIVKFLLTDNELEIFKETNTTYKLLLTEKNTHKVKVLSSLTATMPLMSEDSGDSAYESPPIFNDSNNTMKTILEKILKSNDRIEKKIDTMEDKITMLQEKIMKLEYELKHCNLLVSNTTMSVLSGEILETPVLIPKVASTPVEEPALILI